MQIAFRNRFNLRAVNFVCGVQGSDCSNAFRNWVAALDRSISQLVLDGPANEFNGLTNLGYNIENTKAELDTTMKQL